MPINALGPLCGNLGPIGYAIFCLLLVGGSLWLCFLSERA